MKEGGGKTLSKGSKSPGKKPRLLQNDPALFWGGRKEASPLYVCGGKGKCLVLAAGVRKEEGVVESHRVEEEGGEEPKHNDPYSLE